MNIRSLCAIALLTLAVVGCNKVVDNPATWNQTQVETKLKETLYVQFGVTLTELQLTKGDTGYTGTAKTGAGESYKVVVTTDAAGRKLAYKFQSDRGDHIEGDYVGAQPK